MKTKRPPAPSVPNGFAFSGWKLGGSSSDRMIERFYVGHLTARVKGIGQFGKVITLSVLELERYRGALTDLVASRITAAVEEIRGAILQTNSQ